jgi:hypothetical protein
VTRITRWHPGKLIILWSWGVLIAGLAITRFLTTPVEESPLVHLVELTTALIILVGLSIVTWKWLGDRKSKGL